MPRQAFSPEELTKAIKKSRKKYEKHRINLGKATEEWECQRQVCGGSHIDFALHLLALHRAYCSDLHHGVKKSKQGPQQDGDSQKRQPTARHLETPAQHRSYGELQPLIQETTAEKSSLQVAEPTNTQTMSTILEILQEKPTPFKSLESVVVQEQTANREPQGVTEGMTVESLSLKEEESAKSYRSQEQEAAIEYQSLPQVTAHEFPSLIPETNSPQSHVMQKQTAIPESQTEVMFLPSGQETSSRDAAMAQEYGQNNVQIKHYWCKICQWLVQENELKDHILSHLEGQLVHCAHCVEGFTSERLVLKHLLIHMGVKMRLLPTKGFTLRHLTVDDNVRDQVRQRKKPPLWQSRVATKTAITMHKEDKNQSSVLPGHDLISRLASPPVKCKLCGEGFKYRHDMNKHLPVHVEKTPYQCGMCDKYFTTQDTLSKHETELCDTLEFACGTCGKVFKKKERLKEHELTHSKGPYICETCGKVYRSQATLEAHMYKHTGQWPHKCAICDKGYASISELTSHMASHRNLRPYNCQICGKSFMRKCDVQIHQKTHKVDRPFMCSICGKAFKTKNAAQTHEQSHSEQRNHQCTVCGQRFKQKTPLTNHMSIHSGERDHQCSDCGKLFRTKKDIQKHMLTHSQVRPHKCKVCGDSFRQSGHLVTHMMRHTGEWSHKCNLCEKGFGNPGHLSKHMETKHG